MDRILGQTRALEVLQASLASGKLHHAWVFHGPAGVGKFTTALALARVLLCHDRQTDLAGRTLACGRCESCRLLRDLKAAAQLPDAAEQDEDSKRPPQPQSLSHPDLHVVTKELARFCDDRQIRERKLLTIPFEVLRQRLVEPVYRLPQLHHGKVFIIDEAELIDARGQNILLKTLEEPPPETYLILVTSSEDRLLPTIRSRCQRTPFVPLPEGVLTDWLGRQETTLDEKHRRWLVSFAAGSLGRLEFALRYDLSAWADRIIPAVHAMATQGRFDAGLGGAMAELTDDLAQRWVDGHANASKEAANKMAAGLMWSLLTQYFRGRIAAAAKALTVPPADPDRTGTEPWLAAIEAVQEAELNLAANVNQRLVCEHLALKLGQALSPRG